MLIEGLEELKYSLHLDENRRSLFGDFHIKSIEGLNGKGGEENMGWIVPDGRLNSSFQLVEAQQ